MDLIFVTNFSVTHTSDALNEFTRKKKMWKGKDIPELILTCVAGKEHALISYTDLSEESAQGGIAKPGSSSSTSNSGNRGEKPRFEKYLAEKLFPELKIVKVGCTALTTPSEFIEGVTLGLHRSEIIASSPRRGLAGTSEDSSSDSSQSSNTLAVVISPTREDDDGELADLVIVDGLQSVDDEVLECFYEILTRKEIPLGGGGATAGVEDIKKATSKSRAGLSGLFSFLVYQSDSLTPFPQQLTNRFMMQIPLPEKLRTKRSFATLFSDPKECSERAREVHIVPELCSYMREVIVKIRTGETEEGKGYYVAAGPDPNTYGLLEKAVRILALLRKKDFVTPACITDAIFFVLNHKFVYKQTKAKLTSASASSSNKVKALGTEKEEEERWLRSGRGIDNYLIIEDVLKSIPFPV